MTFREFASENIVLLDGAMGTMLEAAGLQAGELPETWNMTHPDVVCGIHKAYFDAGSNVVNTNTFGANPLKFGSDELENVIRSAIENADRARAMSTNVSTKFISLDIGPLGKLLRPFGDLDFEDAYNAFAAVVKLGKKYGADLITVETMNDSLETKAALLAVKENSDLPVIVTNAYGADGKLISGATPEVMVAMLEGMGADYIGANCSLGPKALMPVMDRIVAAASVPVVLKPNAGLPESVMGKSVYNVSPSDFAMDILTSIQRGVRIVGGCCGTTPEYIAAVAKILKGAHPCEVLRKNDTVITSFCRAHKFDGTLTLIGENINPTGKKRMKQAVREGDIDYIVSVAADEEQNGADALDINVGVPDIDEAEFLHKLVSALQYSTPLPLVIDTSDSRAMERALRSYNGKAMINSVNGKRSSMESIFPLQKKYGGVVIALTLDENGIPASAKERVQIAKHILSVAEEYGIDKKDIVFDPLAMTVSADKNSAAVTLEAVRMLNELGCKTSLGVSNISFGLPARGAINAAFLSMAASAGLSAAIMNPASPDMMRALISVKALLGMDENFATYISSAERYSITAGALKAADTKECEISLSVAIVKGMADTAAKLTEQLLSSTDAMDIITNEIIPALDTVGRGFERGEIYLPGLLLSADTAKCAFEKIKSSMSTAASVKCGKIVIATVRGDIHDIGKNIVKLLLENYGFGVTDLGKDVAPEAILDAAKRECADIVALSALMTTTVPAMEETVKLIHSELPNAKVVVGGAVLTESYAKKIGADAYAKDAMAAVRYAEKIIKNK